MAQHTVLYRNAAVGIGAVNAAQVMIPFSADNFSNNTFLPPWPLELVLAAAFGANLASARVSTPLLIQTAINQLYPLNNTAAPASNFNLVDYRVKPVKFNNMENIIVDSSNSGGAAEAQFTVLMFGDGNYPRASGKCIRLRLDSSTAASAGAWARLPLVPQQSLPNARFAIVNMFVIAATGLCARLDIPGYQPQGKNVRPGVVPLPNIAARVPDPYQESIFGVIGEFTNQTLPALEIFCTAADATQQVWLDVVQL